MRVLINSYIKRDNYGNFMSGQVLFESLVANEEGDTIPESLKVNLSKHHNPECDTPIKFLQTHNGHAGNFGSRILMREYIRRVTADITDPVRRYNADIEEYDFPDEKMNQPILEDNPDLVPPPIQPMGGPPPGMYMMDVDLEEFHKYLESLVEDELDEDEE